MINGVQWSGESGVALKKQYSAKTGAVYLFPEAVSAELAAATASHQVKREKRVRPL